MKKKTGVSKKQEGDQKHGFTITAKFNDQVYEVSSESLEEALLSLKPITLKTNMKILIEKEGKVCDKILPCFEARQIFRNAIARKVFMNRLILK